MLPIPASRPRTGRHRPLESPFGDGDGQVTQSVTEKILKASEGFGPADWSFKANTPDHADESTLTGAADAATSDLSKGQHSPPDSPLNVNEYESWDVSTTGSLPIMNTRLNMYTDINPTTARSNEDSDIDLAHFFVDPYSAFCPTRPHTNDSLQSLIVEDPSSPQNRAIHGMFGEQFIPPNGSDLDGMNGSHARMTMNDANEQNLSGSSPSITNTLGASRYSQVMLDESSNHAQSSKKMRQPNLKSPTELGLSHLGGINFQAFQHTARPTGLESLVSLPEHCDSEDPDFSSLPALTLHSVSEMEMTKTVLGPPDGSTARDLHENRYPAILKIMYGSKTHSALLKLRGNTRSSIEMQAKEYIWANLPQNTPLSRTWTSHLLSVVVKDEETDVSGYEDDDLTFLLEIISQRNVSQFTVKVGCTAVQPC